MEKAYVEDARRKKEEIHALQQRSRGMLRMVAAGSCSRPTASQAPEDTQSEVKLLRAELEDQMVRHKRELAACKRSVHQLSIQRTKSEASISQAQEAASENKLAEKSCHLRWQTEHRVWSEERRRLKAAHHRHMQEEMEKFEQTKQRTTQEMATSRRKLEVEVREARQKQRTAEGKLKRMEDAEEIHAAAADEASEARCLQESAAHEAQRLRERLCQAEDEVLALQVDASRQGEAASKLQASFRLELVAAASAREAMVRDWHSQKRHLLQAMAVDRRTEEEVAEEQAALAEQAALVAADLHRRLQHEALEVQQLQRLRDEDQEESSKLRKDLAALADARLSVTPSAELRALEEELRCQKRAKEEDMAQLHDACEKSLEGLPLAFYQELRSQESGDAMKVPMTVAQYGHILQAVGGYVKTLLGENMELQEAQRSSAVALMQSSDSALSLTHLTSLSGCTSDRDVRADCPNRSGLSKTASSIGRRLHDHRSDTPELSRQVFAVHQELANTREEVRQVIMQRDLAREMHARRSSLDVQVRELSDQNQHYLSEIQVLKEELCARHGSREPMPELAIAAEAEAPGVFASPHPASSRLEILSDSPGAEQLPKLSPPSSLHPAKQRWRRDFQLGTGSPHESEKTRISEPTVLRSHVGSPEVHAEDKHAHDQPRSPAEAGVPESEHSDLLRPKAAALRRAFYCAEQLCERQHYAEALPLLEEVVQYCEGSPEVLGASEMKLSDAWAYIGVANQAEGCTQQSIEAYSKAIRQDECLHVCHANLASLFSFQHEHAEAQHHMRMALRLDAQNPAYINLAQELKKAARESKG